MNDTVTSEERDQTFVAVKSSPENKFCIDCEKKNPHWCSIYFGIHLCIDCAGKHRQFGVMFSFIKSANLDSWTKRQLLFMKRGGNARALEYFKKCGAISTANKTIDYKSAIVQKYKEILMAEVDGEVNPTHAVKQVDVEKKQEIKEEQMLQKQKEKETNLQNKAEEVVQETVAKKGKGKKKIQATKINIEEFDNIEFDNGISKAQKEALTKVSEVQPVMSHTSQSDEWSTQSNASTTLPQITKVQPPKQMDDSTAKATLQKLKQQKNIKALSSDDFKDPNSCNAEIQQNLQKMSNRTGFGSSDIYGQEPIQQSAASKIKNVISDVGEKLYDRFSKYIKK